MVQEEISRCKNCEAKSCAVSMLGDDELKMLGGNVSEVEFEKGETIFKEDTLTSHVMYLREGLVKIHVKISDQRDYILKLVAAPAYLGLPSIFGDCAYQFSATAIEPALACCINISVFKHLIYSNGKFAYEIIADVCRDELNNFRRYVNQTHRQIPGRVAGALIYFSDVIYKNPNFKLSLTRQEIAELTGLSRESVTRCLSSFKAEGIIQIKKNHVSILDYEKLVIAHLNG